MFAAGPPGPPGTDAEPLRLSRARRRVFGGSSESALDPALRRYLSDMVAPYGTALREDVLAAGSGHSYGDMAGALVAQTVPAGQPADLIVLAFAIPDVVPGRSAAAHLSHLCPGGPMAFAVCDQGAAAPFTGLRLISEYAKSGSCRRALLVVVEQAALHYDLAAPAPIPARHVAVALLCSQQGPGVVEALRVHAGIAPAQAGEVLAGELAALSAGRADVTLIAGNGLARLASGAGQPAADAPAQARPPAPGPAACQMLAAPPGQPCTGVWWALAGGLTGWTATGRRVLLADYDPLLRYLCIAAIDAGLGEAARHRPAHHPQAAAGHPTGSEP